MNIEKIEELALQAAIKALVEEGCGIGLTSQGRLDLAIIRGAECHQFAQRFCAGYIAARCMSEEKGGTA